MLDKSTSYPVSSSSHTPSYSIICLTMHLDVQSVVASLSVEAFGSVLAKTRSEKEMIVLLHIAYTVI